MPEIARHARRAVDAQSSRPGGHAAVAQAQDQRPIQQWVRETRRPNRMPPPKSCDCQFHIYGDPQQYPPKPGAYYQPPRASFQDMQGVLAVLGIERGVIVHPMPYDTDHRLLIDTLSGMTPAERGNFRATGIIKPGVSDALLQQLDGLGVVAARFNIGKRYEEANPRDAVMASIARAREIGWHARLHVGGDDIENDAAFLEGIKGITVSIDHMAHLHFEKGLDQPACRWLVHMLKDEGWWMML
jgi:2-pyrone-4,6-dicarboxylate lactonase